MAGKKRGYRKKRMRMFNKKQVKAIRKIANSSGEKKQYELANSTSSFTASGSPYLIAWNSLYAIPQGTGKDDRVGDQITLKSIHFRAFVRQYGTAAHCMVRLLVYQCLEDVDPSFSGFEITSLLPTLNQTKSKYKVLVNKTFPIESDNKHAKVLEYNIKKFPIRKLSYDAGATTTTSGGKIIAVLYTDNVINNCIYVTSQVRLNYKDN